MEETDQRIEINVDEAEVWMELEHRTSTKRSTRRARVRTVEHGTALVQRDVQGVVDMIRVRDNILLVRDFRQALRSPSQMSDRQAYFQIRSAHLPNSD